MARRKRILLYGQHLTGVGHFVRLFEIARELSVVHDVWLVDGGRVVRDPSEAPFEFLTLPRIARKDGRLAPLDRASAIEATFEVRQTRLREAVERISPEILVIEHFPFSKPELKVEILGLIDATKRKNPNARIVCSVRDVLTRRNRPEAGAWTSRDTLELLDRYFDFVVVHADPSFIPMEEHTPWAGEIGIPIEYTGYVSQKLSFEIGSKVTPVPPNSDRPDPPGPPDPPYVVVSSGGCDGTELVETAVEAWNLYRAQGGDDLRSMIVFRPPNRSEEAFAASPGVFFRPFSPHFLRFLDEAALSISHSGYNTCTNLMESRTPVVLVPNRSVSDQEARARRCAERGLATFVDPSELTGATLLAAMNSALQSDPTVRTGALDLGGARRTMELLTELDSSPLDS